MGDSFYLAKAAKNTKADIIVFCGVAFMGESAKIINPDKKVLVPDKSADCAMAHMADAETVLKMREQYPDLAVVCYINSTAELKKVSDVCVTSSNAVQIVKALKNQHIFFIPDENLGRFVQEQIPKKHIILNKGYCPVHVSVTKELLLEEMKKHPEAKVLSHPECKKEVLALSDYIGSTADIISYAAKSDEKAFIICTEDGVNFPLRRENPDKQFYYAGGEICCPDMKKNTPETILNVLQTEENEVILDEETMQKALLPLERMLELAK